MKGSRTIIEELIAVLSSDQVLIGSDLKDRYIHIWTMDQPLKALAVVLPRTTEDVSAIMKICHRHRQSIVVHGGLTNLVGSTETLEKDVVISMEKMNSIEEIDMQSRSMTVQAGVILQNVQTAAAEKDLLFPLNFGAKGSAQMGGVISTNAGGLRVLRFGMTRNLILGLEAVLADGTIISSLKKIVKDNSAYDLKHLFIGSEGTLGIVTKAVLKLVEAPKSRNSAFVALRDYSGVVHLLKFMDARLAGTLSGFELIWGKTYEMMTTAPSPNKPPIEHGHPYYVLIETMGSDQNRDKAALEALLEEALEKELIIDGVLAHSESDLNWFWNIREDVHVLKSRCTIDQHFDISLPISEIGRHADNCIEQISSLAEVEHVFAYGHVADGNIHFLIGKENDEEDLFHQINEIVYNPLQEMGGSVSAEHGIGLDKKPYLSLCRTPAEIELMKTMKRSLDPLGILNPGKVLDL